MSRISFTQLASGNAATDQQMGYIATALNPLFQLPFASGNRVQDQEITTSDTIVDHGLEQKPDSSILNLLLARVYYDLGDKSNAAKYFSVVRDESPELAERYSFIGGSSDVTRRAGISPSETPLIWDAGEE